jgi:large subunit ribosomal protein L32e
MPKKFLRRTWSRYSKLGRGRKKKQRWKKPTGRDNKMREKKRGYPAVVSIGYKKENNSRGKIEEKQPVLVKNILELEKLGLNQVAIIGKIGKNKKIEIAKRAKEKNIHIHNLNIKKFLKQIEKSKKAEKMKKKEEPQKKKEEIKNKSKIPESKIKPEEKNKTEEKEQ